MMTKASLPLWRRSLSVLTKRLPKTFLMLYTSNVPTYIVAEEKLPRASNLRTMRVPLCGWRELKRMGRAFMTRNQPDSWIIVACLTSKVALLCSEYHRFNYRLHFHPFSDFLGHQSVGTLERLLQHLASSPYPTRPPSPISVKHCL
uniref:Secreted protein n=1 Tax=Steinernema glaseri TaxID=37863 RepID=A0A1I7ZE99_9BILA